MSDGYAITFQTTETTDFIVIGQLKVFNPILYVVNAVVVKTVTAKKNFALRGGYQLVQPLKDGFVLIRLLLHLRVDGLAHHPASINVQWKSIKEVFATPPTKGVGVK